MTSVHELVKRFEKTGKIGAPEPTEKLVLNLVKEIVYQQKLIEEARDALAAAEVKLGRLRQALDKDVI